MLKNGFFRNSPADLLCVCVIPFQMAFYVILTHEYHRLSLVALLLLVPVLNALSLQNSGATTITFTRRFFARVG